MNEKIIPGQDMFSAKHEKIEDVLQLVMNHALKTRPVTQPHYQPYKACPGIRFTEALGSQQVNLDTVFPDAKVGEGVFTDFQIRCQYSEDIYLNVSGHVKVWYNGDCIYDGRTSGNADEMMHLPIHVEEAGANAVRILSVKEAEKPFGFHFLISVKRYPGMWANDYLFWARNVIPSGEYAGEEGVAISELLTSDVYEQEDKTFCYYWPSQSIVEDGFDFERLCGDGDCCYVYTEAKKEHEFFFTGKVERIYLNGSAVSCSDSKISLKAGDRLLLRVGRSKEEWRFFANTENVALPFLKSNRTTGDRMMFIGPFYGTQCHAPEYEWDLSKVFVNEKGQSLYWGFADGSELRIYLDSTFYGQWFYALMVGFYGIRSAAILGGDTERQRIFCDNMRALAKYYDYIKYDLKKHTMSAFMPRISKMNVLDNIGTMGMNLVDAYFDSNDSSLLPIIFEIAKQMDNAIPRFEDGTYHRVETMWADDLYMSVPFLVRMGRLTGDDQWYEKAALQLRGFKKRLYRKDAHLFSHIFFVGDNRANEVSWGRGNGWVMWTLTEFLMYAEGHIDVTEQKELFCEMAETIGKLQGENGLWHQVLDRREKGSYPETSCTGMFLLSFTRGVKNGWLGKEYLPKMEKAWNGLLKNSIDQTGNVYGVCMGSGCAMEAEYYYTIPTIINDDHGTGVILSAGAEYGELLKEMGRGNL